MKVSGFSECVVTLYNAGKASPQHHVTLKVW